MTNRRKPAQSVRRKSGTAAVELACGSVFVMVLLMMAIDITIMILGYNLNDRACRAATRSAAQQPSEAKALAAVNTDLSLHKGDGSLVSAPKLSTIAGALVYSDFGGDPHGGNPTVSVATEVTVKLPVPIVFYGAKLGSTAAGVSNSWTFRKKYTYPIIEVSLVLPP